MFLLTIGDNYRNFAIQDVFQHSGKTVSCHFHVLPHVLAAFAKKMIKPSSFNDAPLEILRNMKYYPWFTYCIGAINGTLIPLIVPTKKAVSFKSGRKDECTQNFMAFCSFNMQCT